MSIYVDPIELGEIDRDEIAEETSVSRLLQLHTDLRKTESELCTMIASIKLVDDPPVSMARKLGFVRIARNWVADRLVELGEEVPDDAYGKKLKALRHEKMMLDQKLEARNKKIKNLQAELEALRAKRAA